MKGVRKGEMPRQGGEVRSIFSFFTCDSELRYIGVLPGRAHKHEEVPRSFTAVKPFQIPAYFFFRGAL